MIPGMNPRKMNQMMKKMGVAQSEIDATEVIIRTPEKEIVIVNPSVQKVNMMGQQTYQVSGAEQVRALETKAEINDDDVKTVVDQTGVSEDDARAAIEEADGDLAEAIMKLSGSEE